MQKKKHYLKTNKFGRLRALALEGDKNGIFQRAIKNYARDGWFA